MKIAFFSTQSYDKEFFEKHNNGDYKLIFYEAHLTEQTCRLLQDTPVVCVFVNDLINRSVIQRLTEQGVKLIALRCAGFNNVDLHAAHEFNLKVVRVPAYSPHAVAEHALAMIMTLNRKVHKSFNRIREQNFSLNGLLGFDLYEKTVGVVGTGNIGKVFCKIMAGLGCRVLAYDITKDKELENSGVRYLPLEEMFPLCDIISLHCPLNDHTRYIINDETIHIMKRGVMLINTSRGGLIDTKAVIRGLKSSRIGYLGIDVYEQEENLFFENLSEQIIQDDVIARLMSFPNVLITAHQGFFTREALSQIAQTTYANIDAFFNGKPLMNKVRL